jgi:hypothetical protein
MFNVGAELLVSFGGDDEGETGRRVKQSQVKQRKTKHDVSGAGKEERREGARADAPV